MQTRPEVNESVRSAMTPAQLRDTAEDVTYFLNAFGSTGAVRRKLLEQSSDIHQLGNSVRRLLGKAQEWEEFCPQEEECAANGVVGCDETLDDQVDRIMVDVEFFLEKFGSTRTVRQRLAAQRREIVGLHRTVRWLEDRERRRRRAYGGLQTMAAADIQAVRCASSSAIHAGNARLTLGSDTASCDAGSFPSNSTPVIDAVDICDVPSQAMLSNRFRGPHGGEHSQERRGEHSYSGLWDGFPPFFMVKSGGAVNTAKIRGDRDPLEVISAQEKSDAGPPKVRTKGKHKRTRGVFEDAPTPKLSSQSKVKPFCSYPDCRNQVQVNGLCCRHGGFRMCRVDGCDRRATSRQLCREHGGGGVKCKFDGCDKAASSMGYCFRHSRDDNVENSSFVKCMKKNCGKSQQEGGYCADHKLEDATSQSIDGMDTREVAPASLTSAPVSSRRCKINGCTKRSMRVGNQAAYCIDHQGRTGRGAIASSPGFKVAPRRSTVKVRGHKTCKINGCMKWIRNGNLYCIDHQDEFAGKTVNENIDEAATE